MTLVTAERADDDTADVTVATSCAAGFGALLAAGALAAGATRSGVPADTVTAAPAAPTLAFTPPTETDTTPDPVPGAPPPVAAGSVCCEAAAGGWTTGCGAAGFCAAGASTAACWELGVDSPVDAARAGAVACCTASRIVLPRVPGSVPALPTPDPSRLEPVGSSLCAADADWESRSRVAPVHAAPTSAATASVRPRADLTLPVGCAAESCSHLIVRRR